LFRLLAIPYGSISFISCASGAQTATGAPGATAVAAAGGPLLGGLGGALPAFRQPILLLAGAGVGICSSVIPYVTDQLAMARLPCATFSLPLALLPVFATVIGAIVLRQVPTVQDAVGIMLVVLGVALHQHERK
jgi:inner membrane transporter RhtA